MKLHSDILTDQTILRALLKGRNAGVIDPGVHPDKMEARGSRSRARAWEIHLGTNTKTRDYTGKLRRRPSNSADPDSLAEFGATYAEWGWFIAFLFEADPDLMFGPYTSLEVFDRVTRYAFDPADVDTTDDPKGMTPLTAALAGQPIK